MGDALFDQLVADVPQSARILKRTVLEFADFVADVMSDHRDVYGDQQIEDVVFLREFFARLEPLDMANMFVKYVLPYADQIRNRDDQYFANNLGKLFTTLPEDRISFMRDVLINEKIEAEDKTTIWEFWNTFIMLTEKYKKNK